MTLVSLFEKNSSGTSVIQRPANSLFRQFCTSALALTILLFAQLSSAQVTLFSDDFEQQSEGVWSAFLTFPQLATTQSIKKSGLSSIHALSLGSSVSQQEFSPISTGSLRLSLWVYNNDSTRFNPAALAMRSSNSSASLSFEVSGNGVVTIASDGVMSDYKSDLAVIGSKKWQEFIIDYDFDTSLVVFSFDGAVVHQTTVELDDLTSMSFRTDDPEFYIDDVKIEHTVIQTNAELTDVLNEGFEQGAILGWQAQASDSSVLEITSQVSRTGTYAVSGVAGSAASATMTRPLTPIMDGAVTASAWLRSGGSQASVLGELFLGDGLVVKLTQKEGALSVFANQQFASAQDGKELKETGMSSLQLSESEGEWVQLSISYNFATKTAAFLANGTEFYTINVAVSSIEEIRIGAADSQVYMDDVVVTYTPPVRFTQTPANSFSESINLSAAEVDGNVSISWNKVQSSDGYRLYFSPQAFSNTSEAQSVDLGQNTTLGAALPRGSNYYIVVSAHANGEDIAFSNMQQLTIPFPDILLTTKMDGSKLQANWSSVADADAYRLYYSGSTFSEITTQNFVSFNAPQLALETALPFPSNYYIAIAAVKGESVISKLSNLEQISLGNSAPVFAEPYQNPDWINDCYMSVALGGNRQYSEEEALDFFIQNGGNSPSARMVVDRPLIPKVPELQELTMTSTSGKASSTKIKANLVTRKISRYETQCGTRNDYIIHTDFTTFRHRDLFDINYYASNLRATDTQTLGLAFDVTFGEEDIGNAVNFSIYQVNDAEKVFKAERLEAPNWSELIENTNPFIARGVAKVGTHEAKVVELTDFRSRTDQGMAGGLGVVLRYESTGLDGVTHEYISEPVIYSIEAEFQKLDSNGAVLPDNAAEWACFRDTRTGLIWEGKTKDGGLHDAKHTYSRYSSDPSKSQIGDSALENGGNCSDSTNCDTEKFVQQVNAAGLCGTNDWRLPTLEELKTLNAKTSVRSPFYAYRYLTIADSTWTSTLHDGNYAFYQVMWGWSENFRKTSTGQPAPLSTPASSALKVMLVRKP